tara:strand:+ start:212 stop:1033 length:822 start_codon:yes stop_codon:yes gene_type:complete
MARRSTRGLRHQKGNKITEGTIPPLSSDGNDGDQVMVGTTMYTKTKGRWVEFKSGSGNINDGWHGSQKYVKILPKDWLIDNEGTEGDNQLYHKDALIWDAAANGFADNVPPPATPVSASIGISHNNAAHTSDYGMAAMVAIPIGYWAIACKVYASHSWGPASSVYLVTDPGHTTPIGGTHNRDYGGIQAHNTKLTDGSSSVLLEASGWVNERIVFDTAMLGQDQNYMYLTVNSIPSGPVVIYGGYIELRRVKTAEAIAEEESDTGGDSLPRSG